MTMRARNRGFTLAELLITLAVAAILLGIGIPAMTGLLQRVRATNAFHMLTASLATARVAAIKHGEEVTVCPSSDGRSCRGDAVWDSGWIMYVDPDRERQPPAQDAILRQVDGIGPGLALRSTAGRIRVRFTPDGWSYGSNLRVRLCATDERRLIGAVFVNNAGRPRSERYGPEEPCPYNP